jgi:membrane protein
MAAEPPQKPGRWSQALGWTGRTARGVAAFAAASAVERLLERRAAHAAAGGHAHHARFTKVEPAPPPPPPGPLERIYAVIKTAAYNFFYDDALSVAAMLAFTLVLALFPFLIFLASMAAVFSGPQIAHDAADLLFQTLPDDIARVLLPEVHKVLNEQAGGLVTFGLVVTVVSLTGAVESIREGLNRAYGVTDTRSILRKRYQGLLFVIAGAVALILVALLAVAVPIGVDLLKRYATFVADWEPVLELARILALVLILFLMLLAFHLWLPCHRSKLRRVWIGVVLTILLWFVAGWGFTIYLQAFGGYARTYAGLAGIVAALMFFYIVSAILLLGGEINRAIVDTRRS